MADQKISQLTEKATLVGNDVITILDSEASNANKKAKVSAVTALSTYTASSPIDITNKVVSISTASSTTSGALSSTDWSTFNSKQDTISATTPLDITSNTITIAQSSATTDGYLSSSDFTKFNSKAVTQSLTEYDDTVTTGSHALNAAGFYNKIYRYTAALTSLELTGSLIETSGSTYRYDTEIQFTTAATFTFTATGLASKWIGVTTPSFEPNTAYVIAIKNGYAVLGKVGA